MHCDELKNQNGVATDNIWLHLSKNNREMTFDPVLSKHFVAVL